MVVLPAAPAAMLSSLARRPRPRGEREVSPSNLARGREDPRWEAAGGEGGEDIVSEGVGSPLPQDGEEPYSPPPSPSPPSRSPEQLQLVGLHRRCPHHHARGGGGLAHVQLVKHGALGGGRGRGESL